MRTGPRPWPCSYQEQVSAATKAQTPCLPFTGCGAASPSLSFHIFKTGPPVLPSLRAEVWAGSLEPEGAGPGEMAVIVGSNNHGLSLHHFNKQHYSLLAAGEHCPRTHSFILSDVGRGTAALPPTGEEREV